MPFGPVIHIGRLWFAFLALRGWIGQKFFPFAELRIVSREILHIALAFENKQMIHHLVHEIAVVADYDYTTMEILQILFKHLKRNDVKVICRLVKNQEIGVLHKDGTQVQTAFFSAGEFINIALLLLGSKHEVLQELHGRKMLSATQINVVGNFPHRVNHLHLLVKLDSVLTEIAEPHRLAHHKASAVRPHFAQ